MKTKHFLAILTLCLLTTGCLVLSIHPLYTAKDIILEPSILGVWTDNDSTITYEFLPNDSVSYTLIFTEDSVASSFKAHLLQLGNQLFCDLLPIGPEIENETYQWFLIPSHGFVKVTLNGDFLRLDGIDSEWLTNKIEKGEINIAHEKLDQDRILLTAKTEDLQSFMIKYSTDDEAFPEGDELHRIK